MKTLLTLVFMFSVVATYATPEDPRAAFWAKETDRKLAAETAKQYTFFLRLVIGGGWGPENASYELIYSGDPKDLDLGRKSKAVGSLIRRDPKGEEKIQIEKYELALLVRECINEELFELGSRTKKVTAPDILKMDGCDLWLFIKYGDVENCLGRTDDSIPVWQTYSRIKNLIRPNQSPEPTPTTVTPPAGQEARQP